MNKHTRSIAKVITIALSALVLSNVSPVYAAEENCVTQYGGGVVCGSRTPTEPHAPVNAGFADINMGQLGAALVASSAVLYIYSKRQNSITSQPSV